MDVVLVGLAVVADGSSEICHVFLLGYVSLVPEGSLPSGPLEKQNRLSPAAVGRKGGSFLKLKSESHKGMSNSFANHAAVLRLGDPAAVVSLIFHRSWDGNK